MRSKAVLITGCSSGIGYATAELLAERGWNVYATARKPDVVSVLEAKGAKVLGLDVTDEDSMRQAVDTVTQAEGAVGVLINNAGYSQNGAVESVPMDDVRRQFETNVFGLIRMCQLVLPGMREQRWGKIVNLGSMGGKLTFPGGGLYHATKYSLEAISDALRYEVAGFGIDVILIEPGLITTNFEETSVKGVPQEGPYAEFNRKVGKATEHAYNGPLSKLGGGPEAVAEAIHKSLEAKRPKARYPVTPSARLMMGLRRANPDRVWDLMMRAQFPRP